MQAKGRLAAFGTLALMATLAVAQQPPEPLDNTPNDGDVYYLINQLSALQVDSSSSGGEDQPVPTGDSLVPAGDSLANRSVAGRSVRGPMGQVRQQQPSFGSSTQRWALARSAGGAWEIQSVATGLCLAEQRQRVALSECGAGFADRWELLPASNGYYAIRNLVTHRLLDVSSPSAAAGGTLVTASATGLRAPTGLETPTGLQAPNGLPPQSELWLLRPVFFRGIDNALLEKQEALRIAQNAPWWKDNGQPQDVLGIFKNHGINMIRLRPTSSPPYVDPSVTGCQGNACYAETDAQDLDLAKRAKNLGMSIQLSLLFDGGNSHSIPAAWAADTLQQAQADLYAYVKAEIERYRSAGVMPDLVSIGNEVDTGFLGALGSPTGAQFGNFAALQKSGMQAVQDAASDPALGPPLPKPLTCIHITPAWDLTAFFTLVNQNGIPYDVICQSYYPIYHGPLTDAQAAAANPFDKPVEQDVLVNAANQIGRPIFLIETGEHYENGFNANDPWYPPTIANQRQFLLDLQNVVKAVPNGLGMGVEYWDAAGVNILAYGGPYYFNGGYPPDSIYIWNGLTLFDNADASGSSNPSDPSYSELLTGIDAVGNKLDQTLRYKLVTPGDGLVTVSPQDSGPVHPLRLERDRAKTTPGQQWIIRSNGDGFFQVSSAASMSPPLVLDGSNAGETAAASPNGSPSQEWDVRSLGNGLFQLMNHSSGQPLSLHDRELSLQIIPTL